MIATIERSGKLRWLAFIALIVFSPLSVAAGLGPPAVILSVVTMMLGVEGTLRSWRAGRRVIAGIAALFAGCLLTLLVFPIWCHAGFHSTAEGREVIEQHCDCAWNYDHIH